MPSDPAPYGRSQTPSPDLRSSTKSGRMPPQPQGENEGRRLPHPLKPSDRRRSLSAPTDNRPNADARLAKTPTPLPKGQSPYVNPLQGFHLLPSATARAPRPTPLRGAPSTRVRFPGRAAPIPFASAFAKVALGPEPQPARRQSPEKSPATTRGTAERFPAPHATRHLPQSTLGLSGQKVRQATKSPRETHQSWRA